MHEIFTKDAEDKEQTVVTVDMEISRGTTDRTCLEFRLYKGHELTENALALMAVKPHTQRVSLGIVYVIPVL